MTPEQELMLTKQLMKALYIEKDEGERVSDFEDKVRENVKHLLGL